MAKKLTTQERLRIVLRAENVSPDREPSGLAKLAGVSRQTAWNWLNGEPDMEIDARAAFNIEYRSRDHFRAEWLLLNEEPRTLKKPSPEAQAAIDAVLAVPADKLSVVRDLALALKP